jgi:hypothetical protein
MWFCRRTDTPRRGAWPGERNAFRIQRLAAAASQIEQFFKALKQSLSPRRSWGCSENAVQTQIWTALMHVRLELAVDVAGRPFQSPPALAGIADTRLDLGFGT